MPPVQQLKDYRTLFSFYLSVTTPSGGCGTIASSSKGAAHTATKHSWGCPYRHQTFLAFRVSR
ncbi:hypothetical protein, partial [Nostoc linckia]|uniref:hypothetical protein n=1 Tax=Nostoc linckia TaxID=92942 RepID=UPI001C559373